MRICGDRLCPSDLEFVWIAWGKSQIVWCWPVTSPMSHGSISVTDSTVFLFCKTFRPALPPAQSSFQRVSKVLSRGVKLTAHLHVVSKFRMRGSLRLHLHTPLWHGHEQRYVLLLPLHRSACYANKPKRCLILRITREHAIAVCWGWVNLLC
jgi:hypothetical protein